MSIEIPSEKEPAWNVTPNEDNEFEGKAEMPADEDTVNVNVIAVDFRPVCKNKTLIFYKSIENFRKYYARCDDIARITGYKQFNSHTSLLLNVLGIVGKLLK